PPPRSGARRAAARAVRPLSPQAAGQRQRPQRLAPLLRGLPDQAHPARLRFAHRRPRRPPSGDHRQCRARRRGTRARLRPPAALPARRLIVRLDLDRHRAGRRQQQARDGRAALAEGRGLELVAGGVAVELEALGLGSLLEPVEVPVEVRDPLGRVEAHGLFKVGHPTPLPARLRRGNPVPTPGPMKTLLIAATLAAMAAPAPASAQPIDARTQARIDRILKKTPLIDGHNDIAEQLAENYKRTVAGIASGTDQWRPKPLMTDMARLHRGRVGGQFWSVYIDGTHTGDAAIRETLQQIDIVRRMIDAYPNDLELAAAADDVVRIHRQGRIASMIGVEGGRQMGGSLAALRQYYNLGARYMTLTHNQTTEWADSATDDPKYGGLSPFGETVVHEMNRIGMLVDLSHVSPATMKDAITASRAPVIFSHSSARGLVD